jgi:hypothetical protein
VVTRPQRSGPWGKDGDYGYAWNSCPSPLRSLDLMAAAMLTGDEFTLFGQRARVHLEWLDGLPPGMTEGQLRQMGEDMKNRAIRQAPDA